MLRGAGQIADAAYIDAVSMYSKALGKRACPEGLFEWPPEQISGVAGRGIHATSGCVKGGSACAVAVNSNLAVKAASPPANSTSSDGKAKAARSIAISSGSGSKVKAAISNQIGASSIGTMDAARLTSSSIGSSSADKLVGGIAIRVSSGSNAGASSMKATVASV